MTLRADRRQWYGHGQASNDAAHEQPVEHDHRLRSARMVLSAMSAAARTEGWTPLPAKRPWG